MLARGTLAHSLTTPDPAPRHTLERLHSATYTGQPPPCCSQPSSSSNKVRCLSCPFDLGRLEVACVLNWCRKNFERSKIWRTWYKTRFVARIQVIVLNGRLSCAALLVACFGAQGPCVLACHSSSHRLARGSPPPPTRGVGEALTLSASRLGPASNPQLPSFCISPTKKQRESRIMISSCIVSVRRILLGQVED